MRIVIDGRIKGRSGIGRYCDQLLENLQKIDSTNEYIVLLPSIDYESWKPSAKNFRTVRADYPPYSLKRQLILPFVLYGLKPDIVHSVDFTLPIFYFGKRVATVFDLTLVNFKNIRGGVLARPLYVFRYWAMRLLLSTTIRNSMVITSTQYVKKDILSHWRGKSSDGVAITPLGVDSLATTAKTYPGIEGDFLLYVGNFYPHKNIGQLLKAFVLIREQQPELKLVIVGKADYFQEQLRLLSEEIGLGDSVVWGGYVPDAQLEWLYEHAMALVFPSLSEGFGLPALEAMAAGTPVISSNATCLPEVCGEAAEYFDPTDIDEISQVVLKTIGDKARLKELKLAGAKRIQDFSWKKMAEETVAIYEDTFSK